MVQIGAWGSDAGCHPTDRAPGDCPCPPGEDHCCVVGCPHDGCTVSALEWDVFPRGGPYDLVTRWDELPEGAPS